MQQAQMAGIGGVMESGALDSEPTPQEQAMYDAIVSDIEKVLYSDKTRPRILEMLKQSDDPTDAIMNVLMALGKREKEGFDRENVEVPDEVWRAAAEELVPAVAELGQAQGVFPELTEDHLNQALAKLTMAWASQYQPDGAGIQQMMQRVPPQIVQSIQQNAASSMQPQAGIGAPPVAGAAAGAGAPPAMGQQGAMQ